MKAFSEPNDNLAVDLFSVPAGGMHLFIPVINDLQAVLENEVWEGSLKLEFYISPPYPLS